MTCDKGRSWAENPLQSRLVTLRKLSEESLRATKTPDSDNLRVTAMRVTVTAMWLSDYITLPCDMVLHWH